MSDINMPAQSYSLNTVRHQQQRVIPDHDVFAEETAIALVYNGISHAVMMATPADLHDFALGFSLTEGIIASPADIYGIDIKAQREGIELHIELSSERFNTLKNRRRQLVGRTGCGLCGAESLQQVMQKLNALGFTQHLDVVQLEGAFNTLREQQVLFKATGATHAAAWLYTTSAGMPALNWLREDVGRHNALDKLIGARARSATTTEESCENGVLLLTSRASYEMVQKAIIAGIEIAVSLSAPTALAIRLAAQHGLTLLRYQPHRGISIFSHDTRIMSSSHIEMASDEAATHHETGL